MTPLIEREIINFLNCESSIEELNFLLKWIEKKNNLKVFKDYTSVNHFSNLAMSRANQEKNIKEKSVKVYDEINDNYHVDVPLSMLFGDLPLTEMSITY